MWKSGRVKTIFAVAGAAILIYSGLVSVFGDRAVPTVFAQQDMYLSRRIDQIEQRFFSVESRLNRIEQDSRAISVAPPIIGNNNDNEIQYLRSQVEALRERLGEVECGLLRVDERTLTPATKAAKGKATGATDKCRLDPGRPVILSVRP